MSADKYLQRWREQDIEAFLEGLCPREATRRLAAQCIVETITAAHKHNPSLWGITRLAGLVRLNFGRLEALALGRLEARPRVPKSLFVMADMPTLRRTGVARQLARLILEDYGPFRSAPDSRYIAIPITSSPLEFRRLCDLTKVAHLKHLELASKTPINPMTRRGHHPGLVDLIGRIANHEVPQPSYVKVKRPPTSSGTPPESHYEEGAPRSVVETVRERDPRARRDCLHHHGTTCSVCKRSLEAVYGSVARDMIHVHHLDPLAERDTTRKTDPIRDLRPLCPNCHGVIHRKSPIPYTIKQMQAFLRKQGHNT